MPVVEVIVRAAWAAVAMVIVVGGRRNRRCSRRLAAMVAVTMQVPALVSDNVVPEIEQPAVPPV